MKKAILAASVLMFVFTFPAISLAGGDHHEKHGKHHEKAHGKKHSGYAHMVLSKAEKLKLSNEQLGSIMRIHLEHKKIHKDLMKELHGSMVDAYKGLMNPATEDDAIRAAAKEHADALNEMVEHALKQRSEVNSVLTEEQKNELISIRKKCAEKEDDHDDD